MYDTFYQGRDIRLIQKMTVYYHVTLFFFLCSIPPPFLSLYSFSAISLFSRESFHVYMAWTIISSPPQIHTTRCSSCDVSPEYRVVARLFDVPSESPVRMGLLRGELHCKKGVADNFEILDSFTVRALSTVSFWKQNYKYGTVDKVETENDFTRDTGTCSSLYNRYRLFPRGKAAGAFLRPAPGLRKE